MFLYSIGHLAIRFTRKLHTLALIRDFFVVTFLEDNSTGGDAFRRCALPRATSGSRR